MAKSIIYNEDARRALEKGMDLLRGGHICDTVAVRNLAKDYNK